LPAAGLVADRSASIVPDVLVIVRYAALWPPAAAGRAQAPLIDMVALDDEALDPHAAIRAAATMAMVRRGS
jgi:hypothetical protein